MLQHVGMCKIGRFCASSGAGARTGGGGRGEKQKGPGVTILSDLQKTAATYSPTWWGSTIGDGELNFSVRNGKRWFLTAITAAYIT